MSRRSLQSCSAIVTGASGGIGRALALELARRGATLFLAARREKELNAAATECESLGSAQAIPVCGDITSSELREQIVKQVLATGRPLDLLVNNAGVSAFGRFVDAEPQRLSQIMAVNFTAACELTRSSVPLMQGSGAPAVVNIGSILGYRGIPYNSEYCASKAALRLWSESLRTELIKQGIDVMLVTPGSTDTGFFDHLIEKQGDIPWAGGTAVTPEFVARKTIEGLQRRKQEVIPGWRAKAFVWATRHFPWVMDWAMRRYK